MIIEKRSTTRVDYPYISGALWCDEEYFTYCVMAFKEGSHYGIKGGCISKLRISDPARGGSILVNYDRGWDLKPKTDSTRAVFEYLVKKYN